MRTTNSGLESLIGLQLERCRFGKAFYEFEFEGTLNGKFRCWSVGTNYNATTALGSEPDAESKISTQIWPLLGRTLAHVRIGELPDRNEVVFEFEDGRFLRVWQDPGAADNLLAVRDPNSEEWFVVL